ncbi:Os06g0523900 [Oryza sativa Japonica Group]|uniref:Os06g0523800 protein n=2 Tax=Oryza sativa subsp. japonica TaxID=39947 RepID=A0A0P0WX71_ORYSJ|nr:Os06g0523800 [Oryza sativa Japonica Group]BAS98023.1 Os06g0523900 [Oryza sativa Japonica Group]|eukprot:NP_001174825.1 Os06g0523800 [Oryza sativa Japonica Group]
MALAIRAAAAAAGDMAPSSASDPTLGFLTKRDTEVKLPRATRVKNKTPASVQITAEQILREARSGRSPRSVPPSRRSPTPSSSPSTASAAARSSRTPSAAPGGTSARGSSTPGGRSGRGTSPARAPSTSAPSTSPTATTRSGVAWICRVRDAESAYEPNDQLWYKYIHMEQVLGAVANARKVFELWMAWRPDAAGWNSYIKFELRYGEIERVRAIFERFVAEHPQPHTFILYAKFEMKRGEVERARRVYERAADLLADDEHAEVLFVAFAEFEERCREVERARAVYKYALDRVPKGQAEELYRKFLAFEKQFGDREGIEDAIVGKRRFQYEDEVRKNPLNYDSWFDYIRLEESVGNKDRIREVYERAIANIPPAEEKRYWQRYIYLWINYALYEELDAKDMERTREVYSECLKLIPHKKLTFSKMWLMAAQFEIRQKNLKAARRILGNAIGMAPKGKIFKKYIEIELYLGNFERCRTLYEKYIEWSPANCYAWMKYAELEKSLGETDRARSIYELAIAQSALDTPEVLWKEYLQFEIDKNEFHRTCELYERLLDRTKDLKASVGLGGEDSQSEEIKNEVSYQQQQIEQVRRCRAVFERAFEYFRTSAPELKEERAMLLEEWLNKEVSFGHLGDVTLVQKKAPRKVKRKRPDPSEDGSTTAYEEYMDYIFPDEVALAPNLKILEAAYKWKKQKTDDTDDD